MISSVAVRSFMVGSFLWALVALVRLLVKQAAVLGQAIGAGRDLAADRAIVGPDKETGSVWQVERDRDGLIATVVVAVLAHGWPSWLVSAVATPRSFR